MRSDGGIVNGRVSPRDPFREPVTTARCAEVPMGSRRAPGRIAPRIRIEVS